MKRERGGNGSENQKRGDLKRPKKSRKEEIYFNPLLYIMTKEKWKNILSPC